MASNAKQLSVLVHGAAKAGKSTFASTSPKPLLYIDVEGGTRFLPLVTVPWDPNREAPPVPDGTWDTAVVVGRDWDTVLRAYQWLASGQHHFAAVVVDSISELQQKVIEKVSGRAQPQQNQWGEVLRQFTGLLRDFRDLTLHPNNPIQSVVHVAMSRPGGDGLMHPWLQGQSATVVPYLYDVTAAMIAQTYPDNEGNILKIHRLLVDPNTQYETGERVGGRLPGFMDNPSVVTMIEMIYGPSVPLEPVVPIAAA